MKPATPPFRSHVLLNLQSQIEHWLTTAPLDDVKNYLADLHGALPDDLDTLACGKWSDEGQSRTSCPQCDYFVLAMDTVALTCREELRTFSRPSKTQRLT